MTRSRRKAALAAGAGLVSLAVFIGGGLAALRLSFTQFGLMPFGGGQTLNPAIAVLGIVAVCVAAAFSLTLPPLALEVSWRRSLVAAVLGAFLFLVLVALVVFPTPLKVAWIFLALAATPALLPSVALVGAAAPGAVCPVVLLLWLTSAAFCAASLLAYSVFPRILEFGFALVIASWPVLPALAALLRRT